jgi:hypothetical protein
MWRYEGRRDPNAPGCKTVEVILPSGFREVLRHRLVWHSPDGFQWGYGGSGPTDLALNMLFDCLGRDQRTDAREVAERYYQEFKNAFITTAPNHLRITSDEILDWVEEKLV